MHDGRFRSPNASATSCGCGPWRRRSRRNGWRRARHRTRRPRMAERSLLVEIGVEELPIHAVDELAQAFAKGVCDGLASRGIAAGIEHARTFATPRRLAVWLPDVAFTQPEQRSESFGPYVNIALDADGQ